MENLRIAFIGAGRMGQTHIRNLAGIAGITVAVVADTVPANAELGKAIARAERSTTDIDSAISAGDAHSCALTNSGAGHAVPFGAGFTRDEPDSGSGSPQGANGEAGRASTLKLLDLVEREQIGLVIFGHDQAQWATLKKAPAFYE